MYRKLLLFIPANQVDIITYLSKLYTWSHLTPNSYTEKTLPPPLLDTVKMAHELNSHPNHILPYSGT